ncbi:MAG: hypothetical protein ACREOS_04125, partial [Candidatus Dormibacteraceae bacterium]
YATTSDILQPAPPPPAPPPRPIEPAPVREPVAVAPADVVPPNRPIETRPDADVQQPRMERPGVVRPTAPHPPRPPREAPAARLPGPASAGQIDQIHSLARRMGLDDAALVEHVGGPLDKLDHLGARAAIATLRKAMEDSGTWQPKIAEGPDQEAEYLGKLRARHATIDVQLINGERFQGTVEDCSSYVIRLRESESGSEVYLRKLAIAYYRTQGPIDDAE